MKMPCSIRTQARENLSPQGRMKRWNRHFSANSFWVYFTSKQSFIEQCTKGG
jgi:hypothetical protein